MEVNATDLENLEIAKRWCQHRGVGWTVQDTAGRGGTAPVFSVTSPNGPLALKLYDQKFSSGSLGEESERRLTPQIELGLHDCPYLIRVHDGGRFEGRLFVLMDRAQGKELEKCLREVPRTQVRGIIDQVARATIFLRERNLSHRDIKSANIFISEDFSKATLLDLSVLRDIHDPIGRGTDHGGELPVVATSRYSPPEYLFRLIPPSADSWHALDIYQLGGVLHDLIMREPMFEAEYLKTRETNRYRFAWIVATQEPLLSASDVDADLVVLARRALDKNWERRSRLRLEDFLNEAAAHRATGLLALGANIRGKPTSTNTAQINQQLNEVSEEVELLIMTGLKEHGLTTTHDISRGTLDRRLRFGWTVQTDDVITTWTKVSFEITLKRLETPNGVFFEQSVSLSAERDGTPATATIALPDVKYEPGAITMLGAGAMTAFADLAAKLQRL